MFVNGALRYLKLIEDAELLSIMRSIMPLYVDPSDRSVLPGSGDEGDLMERLTAAYFQSLAWSLFVTGIQIRTNTSIPPSLTKKS